MAKNWTAKEAAQVIREGKDLEAIKDIGSRFPIFAVMAAGNDVFAFAEGIPESISARQMESAFRTGMNETDETEPEQKQEKKETKKTEKPAEKTEEKKGRGRPAKEQPKTEAEDEWYDLEDAADEKPDFTAMTGDELKAACKEFGVKPEKGMKRADVVKLLNAAYDKRNGGSDDEDVWDI